MILLDALTIKLFISIKPDNPPVDLYMTGIIRKLEERRQEDLNYIDKLTYELKVNKSALKAANNEVEDYLFQLEEKKEVIESQKAAIKELQSKITIQEDKIAELNANVFSWIKRFCTEDKKLKISDYNEYLAEALDNERKERERLQTILSNIKELLGKLNYDIT